MACSSCAARSGGSYRPQVSRSTPPRAGSPRLLEGPVADLPEEECEPDPIRWKEMHRRISCLKTAGLAPRINSSVAHLNAYLGIIQTVQNAPNPCKYVHNLVHIEALLSLADERGVRC